MKTSPTPILNLPGGKLHISILLAFTLLGTYLRFFNLSKNSVWADEGMTAFFSSLPYRTLWTTPLEPHPPLYYSLVRMFFEYGDGEGTLRLVSAISGALAIPIVYAIGRVCVTPSVGLIAALILSVSNVHIEYSQEARSYTFITTLFAIMILFSTLYCKSIFNNSEKKI